MRAASVTATIGRTPHTRLSRLYPLAAAGAKSERSNPGGLIKDRIALAMVEAAGASGELSPGGTIIEPTSGKTGVGLVLVAPAKGCRLNLAVPEAGAVSRGQLMLAHGANRALAHGDESMKGAIERAREWRTREWRKRGPVDILPPLPGKRPVLSRTAGCRDASATRAKAACPPRIFYQ